ncbi:helix-turn-helix domain-containing protein [Corynebacterium glucuronolyticum]|nr:helix-turn-helix domain-containing protein [Corynebacterium glucuronolyticum]
MSVPRTYSLTETAEILGMSKATISRFVQRGKADQLKPIKLGTAIRFPRAVIDKLAPQGDAA